MRLYPRYNEGSDFSQRSPPLRVLPAYLALPSNRSIPNHAHRQCVVYHQTTHIMISRLRLLPVSSPPRTRRIRFVILQTGCSPPVASHPASWQMQLLSVTEFLAFSDTDFHRDDKTPSQAHWERLQPRMSDINDEFIGAKFH